MKRVRGNLRQPMRVLTGHSTLRLATALVRSQFEFRVCGAYFCLTASYLKKGSKCPEEIVNEAVPKVFQKR